MLGGGGGRSGGGLINGRDCRNENKPDPNAVRPRRCRREIAPAPLGRWLHYRDNRNDTAHNHGEDFAAATLGLPPVFVTDAKALASMIEAADDG